MTESRLFYNRFGQMPENQNPGEKQTGHHIRRRRDRIEAHNR